MSKPKLRSDEIVDNEMSKAEAYGIVFSQFLEAIDPHVDEKERVQIQAELDEEHQRIIREEAEDGAED